MTPTNSTGAPNVVNLLDGTTHVFPSDATQEEMQKALTLGLGAKGKIPEKFDLDPALSSAIDTLRPIIAGGVGALSGAGATIIPVAGQIPGVPLAADIAGYAATDRLLSSLKPLQQTPAGQQSEGISDSIKDGFINAVGSRILGGTWRTIKAFDTAGVPEIYKYAPTSAQALEAYGHHKIATMAKFAEDFGAAGAKAAALDKAGGAGFTQALAFANSLNGRFYGTNVDPVKLSDKIRGTLKNGLTPGLNPTIHHASDEALDILRGGQNPFQKIDDVLQDPNRLGKVLNAGDLQGTTTRNDLQAYQFMRMMHTASTRDAQGNVVRIDPNRLSTMFNDPDMNTSLNALYGKDGMKDVRNFIQNLSYTQDKQQTYPVAKQLRLVGSGFKIGTALLSGNLHMAASTATDIAGFYLPMYAMGKLLTSPTTSKIVTRLAGSQPLSASAQYVARVLTSVIQGMNIAVIDSKGNKQWGTVEKTPDGSGDFDFVPNR